MSDSELEVIEAIALDGRPTAEIWRYLLDIDWAARITAGLLPVDHPLWWLLANPRRMRPRIGDGLWVRLVDVGAALSARTYAADGAVVFDVIDEFCPWNAGRWRVSGRGAKRTTAAAQLRLDVSALGSAYLGGFTFSQLAARRAGRGAAPRRRSACGRDVRGRARAVVPRDLLMPRVGDSVRRSRLVTTNDIELFTAITVTATHCTTTKELRPRAVSAGSSCRAVSRAAS